MVLVVALYTPVLCARCPTGVRDDVHADADHPIFLLLLLEDDAVVSCPVNTPVVLTLLTSFCLVNTMQHDMKNQYIYHTLCAQNDLSIQICHTSINRV